MRNKSLSILSFLTLTGILVALAAGPALAWSSVGYTPATSWWNPAIWTSAPAPKAAPALKAAPAPVQSPAVRQAPAPVQSLAPTPTAGLTAQEQQMLDLLNQDRAQNGVKPLVADLNLTRVARLKAQDMVTNNYFDHNSPSLGLPPQMVQNAGIAYSYGVGENIVEAPTVGRMNLQLMESPTHKANILDPKFTAVGIGVVPDNYGGLMAAQEFIGR